MIDEMRMSMSDTTVLCNLKSLNTLYYIASVFVLLPAHPSFNIQVFRILWTIQ